MASKKNAPGTSVPHAHPKNSALATLANLDRYLLASSYDEDHPWRVEIAAALSAPDEVIDPSTEAVVKEPDAPIPTQDRGNPYFHDANRAASELFYLLRDGLPATAASADDRLRLEAVKAHAENEIQSLADGFSAIGTLVQLTSQVADDAGISGSTILRIGILIDHLAVTLDAVNELRSDAAFTLGQAARGAA